MSYDTIKLHFPELSPKTCKIVTTNLVYMKTLHVWLKKKITQALFNFTQTSIPVNLYGNLYENLYVGQ